MTVLVIGTVVIDADPDRVEDWASRLLLLGLKPLKTTQAGGQGNGYVLAKGRAKIVVRAVRPGTAAAACVAARGDTFTDVAFYVDDVCAAHERAVAAGAASVAQPVMWFENRLAVVVAAAGGPGVTHTLYHVTAAHVLGPPEIPGFPSLAGIDAVTLAVADPGAVRAAAAFYETAFGFTCTDDADGVVVLRSGYAQLTVECDPAAARHGPAVSRLTLTSPVPPRRLDLMAGQHPEMSAAAAPA